MQLNLPELAEVLEESEFFERERTDRQSVELAILLYNHGVSLRKVKRVLGWLGVERSHVAIWRWIQELKRRIDTFYASFTGHEVETTNNWLNQFAWTWNVCLS